MIEKKNEKEFLRRKPGERSISAKSEEDREVGRVRGPLKGHLIPGKSPGRKRAKLGRQ